MTLNRVIKLCFIWMFIVLNTSLAHAAETFCSSYAATHPGYTCGSINYGNASYQNLDIYRPSQSGLYPVLIYVHGGSWINGDKNLGPGADYTNVLRELANGYAVVSINYRSALLDTASTAPGALLDVKLAIKWVKKIGWLVGLDASRIMLWGYSAGGHLATLAAATVGDAGTEPAEHSDVNSSVKFVFSFAGAYDFKKASQIDSRGAVMGRTAIYGASLYLGCKLPNFSGAAGWPDPAKSSCSETDMSKWSPTRVITSGDPHVVLVHNRNDNVVPFSQAENYISALFTGGAQPGYCYGNNGGHETFSECQNAIDSVLPLFLAPGPR